MLFPEFLKFKLKLLLSHALARLSFQLIPFQLFWIHLNKIVTATASCYVQARGLPTVLQYKPKQQTNSHVKHKIN